MTISGSTRSAEPPAPPQPASAAAAADASSPVRRTTLPTRPERSPELAHLNLDRLRTYRRTLLDEELRASYWRRLVQGRRDILRTNSIPGDRDGLVQALTEERNASGRQVILTLHPDAGMPILPKLPELWASTSEGLDDAERARLFASLANAESVLSSYREALHKRLDRATADLVARYHDDPTSCFVAIPAVA